VFSKRFLKPIVLTRHATQRMIERKVDARLVNKIVDEGETRFSDAHRLWAWMQVEGRDDNLLCLALVLDQAVVVKTVMHRWEIDR
jgi:Domain of unknown function (DUF4258)